MALELRATHSGFRVWCAPSEPPFSPIPSLARPELPGLYIFGSSVSLGKGAKKNKGWVDLVRQKAQFLMEVKNMSVSGGSTETMLHVLMGCEQESLLVAPEDVAVVSLSLSNEGLARDGADHVKVASSFLQGIIRIISKLEALGFRQIILATPYPCSKFDTAAHQETAQNVIRQLSLAQQSIGAGVQIVDFFNSRLNDGTGKWMDTFRADDFHPNAAGHAVMAAVFLERFTMTTRNRPLNPN